MSHNSLTRFDQPLQVEPETSRLLLTVAATLYGLAAVAWWCTPTPLPVRLAVSIVLILHFIYLYRVHISVTPASAVQTLDWNPLRGWRLCGGDGQWFDAQLLLPVFVTHRLVAVRFRVGRFDTRSLVVVGDRLSGDDFRRLRVRLLQSAHGD